MEERGKEDGRNILKVSTFNESSRLLSSPLLTSQTYPMSNQAWFINETTTVACQ